MRITISGNVHLQNNIEGKRDDRKRKNVNIPNITNCCLGHKERLTLILSIYR